MSGSCSGEKKNLPNRRASEYPERRVTTADDLRSHAHCTCPPNLPDPPAAPKQHCPIAGNWIATDHLYLFDPQNILQAIQRYPRAVVEA